jgi:hypothetical protein
MIGYRDKRFNLEPCHGKESAQMFSSRVVKIVVWIMLAAMLLSIVVSGISFLLV